MKKTSFITRQPYRKNMIVYTRMYEGYLEKTLYDKNMTKFFGALKQTKDIG